MLFNLVLESLIGAAAAYAVHSRRARFFLCNGNLKPLLACTALVLSFLIYLELPSERNLYDVVALPTDTTAGHVATRYRVILHHLKKEERMSSSDKKLKLLHEAYETLSNDTKRAKYNRFGDFLSNTDYLFAAALLKDEVTLEGAVLVLSLSAAFCILAYVIGALLTFPKKFRGARQVILLYLVGVFCLEMHIRFIGDPITLRNSPFANVPIFGKLLPFERVQLTRRLFPSVLCLAMGWSGYGFVDHEESEAFLLKGILQTNKAILMRLPNDGAPMRAAPRTGGTASASAPPWSSPKGSKQPTAAGDVSDAGGDFEISSEGGSVGLSSFVTVPKIVTGIFAYWVLSRSSVPLKVLEFLKGLVF